MNDCVSLDMAKKLKAAGYPQGESYFYWKKYSSRPGVLLMHDDDPFYWKVSHYRTGSSYAAPIVGELGERLPAYTQTFFDGDNWRWDARMVPGANRQGYKQSEADARAAMWIWLSENGHIEGATS